MSSCELGLPAKASTAARLFRPGRGTGESAAEIPEIQRKANKEAAH